MAGGPHERAHPAPLARARRRRAGADHGPRDGARSSTRSSSRRSARSTPTSRRAATRPWPTRRRRFDKVTIAADDLLISQAAIDEAHASIDPGAARRHPRRDRPGPRVQRGAARGDARLAPRDPPRRRGGGAPPPDPVGRPVRPVRQGLVPERAGDDRRARGGRRRAGDHRGRAAAARDATAWTRACWRRRRSWASRAIVRANGPAGVAAVVLGTQTIGRVAKIVGPGSPAVTAAQILAQLHGVGTNMLCGPSEIAGAGRRLDRRRCA